MEREPRYEIGEKEYVIFCDTHNAVVYRGRENDNNRSFLEANALERHRQIYGTNEYCDLITFR